MQKFLNTEHIKNFHIDVFVKDQINDFLKLIDIQGVPLKIVDIGGGVGYFATKLQKVSGFSVRVIDADLDSTMIAKSNGVDAMIGDASHPSILGDEDIITFNLILHHLVGLSEIQTFDLQTKSLKVWHSTVKAIFVNEYIYESYINGLSGCLIYAITKSKLLSKICRLISSLIPSLRANTFGVGVRFRSHDEWVRLFECTGYKVESYTRGQAEFVSWPRRLLFIKEIRRDSFLLIPNNDALKVAIK